jgi:hypothetical protein
MSSPQFEAFLARLYSDQPFRDRFLSTPEQALDETTLDSRERAAARAIDRPGLLLAARSYEAKRTGRSSKQGAKRRWPFT